VNKILAATLLAALAVSQLVLAQTGKKVDDVALRNAANNPAEWITYGITQGETRFSPLDQINAGNVGRPGLASSATAICSYQAF
jgi:quinohemoprotein ethanol dehydrogenase